MYLLIAKLSDTIVLSPIDMSLSMKLVKGVIMKDPPTYQIFRSNFNKFILLWKSCYDVQLCIYG